MKRQFTLLALVTIGLVGFLGAQPAETQPAEAQEPLTPREQKLLDRVEKLEQRIAELEQKLSKQQPIALTLPYPTTQLVQPPGDLAPALQNLPKQQINGHTFYHVPLSAKK